MSKQKSINRNVERRNEEFVEKQSTKIWQEQPSELNPYIAKNAHCFGYDLLQLMDRRSYTDVLYLIFRGELPTAEQSDLLEKLMIAFINPGPRHPATRAAMNAGIGKTDQSHILPISLSILSGKHLGAGEIEDSMRFIRKNLKNSPREVATALMQSSQQPNEGDWHIAPGFGNRFGGRDELSIKISLHLKQSPAAGSALSWGMEFSEAIEGFNMGWLATGVAAATMADLKFQPRAGGGLFQLISAPGLLAHGLELSNKPFTALPFPKDEDYFID